MLTDVALLYSSREMEIAAPIELGLRPLDWLLLAGLAALSLLLVFTVVRSPRSRQLRQPACR